LRYAAMANGAMPSQWTTLIITGVKAGVQVNNLTLGVTYAFQVRALGKLGFTDWSDVATRMSV
jgi:hypothetical protein